MRELTDSAPTRLSILDRLLRTWQGRVATHIVRFHLVVSLFLVLVFQLVFLTTKASLSIPETLAVECGIVLTAFGIPALATILALRRELALIIHLTSQGPDEAIEVKLRLIREELKELEARISDVQTVGTTIGAGEAATWVSQRLFKASESRYIDISVDPPSKYLEANRDYMRVQREYLIRTHRSDSARVLVGSPADLENDRKTNSAMYDEFVEWHSANGVSLLYLPRELLAGMPTFQRLQNLRGVIDMAVWDGEAVLLWDAESNPGNIVVRVAFAGDSIYQRCSAFLYEAIRSATELSTFSL
jgi:hypothetical protein